MTTSVLATHVRGSLSERDIEVIRDYALEAPWEWRIALEELCDDAEATGDVELERDEALRRAEEAAEASKELRASVKAAVTKLKAHVMRLEAGLTKGDLDTIAEGIDQALDDLRDL